jgi:RimJ/RimL family protein N-acetyltransferase
MTLQVLKVNHAARRLYERLGFLVLAETPTHSHMSTMSTQPREPPTGSG